MPKFVSKGHGFSKLDWTYQGMRASFDDHSALRQQLKLVWSSKKIEPPVGFKITKSPGILKSLKIDVESPLDRYVECLFKNDDGTSALWFNAIIHATRDRCEGDLFLLLNGISVFAHLEFDYGTARCCFELEGDLFESIWLDDVGAEREDVGEVQVTRNNIPEARLYVRGQTTDQELDAREIVHTIYDGSKSKRLARVYPRGRLIFSFNQWCEHFFRNTLTIATYNEDLYSFLKSNAQQLIFSLGLVGSLVLHRPKEPMVSG